MPPVAAAPQPRSPARSAQPARATARRSTVPADARTALGPNGSAQPSSTATAGAPAAAAVRHSVPTLPGSCRPSSTTSGQRAARAAASASPTGTSSRLAIASTPCGVTVWLSDANARSASVTTRCAGTSSSTPSRRASTSSSTPQATASRTTRGPSRRTSPGSRRRPSRRSLRTSSLSVLLRTSGWSEVVLRNLHQPCKGAAVAHRQVGEHFAVDLHTGLAEPEHEPVVRQPALASGRVDPRDPEPPEVPLALAPVAERVGQRVQDRLVRGPEQQLPRIAEALGPLQDRLVLAMGDDASLDSSHETRPPAPAGPFRRQLRPRAGPGGSRACASPTCSSSDGSSKRAS